MTQPAFRNNPMQEIDGPYNTYVANFVGQSVGTAAATTDIFSLYASASMIIRIVQIVVGVTIAVAATTFDLIVATRSTIFTAGTPVPITPTPQYPDDPISTATAVNFFTAPPTAGTVVGNQGVQKLFAPLAGALTTPVTFNFGFGAGSKALKLRSGSGATRDGMALTLNGVQPANVTSFSGFVIFTESPN